MTSEKLYSANSYLLSEQALFERIEQFLLKDDCKNAFSLLMSSLDSGPSDEGGLCFRAALVFHINGCFNEAEEFYRLAISRDHADPASQMASYMNLGSLCEGLRRFNEAKSFYQQAMLLEGNPAINKKENTSMITMCLKRLERKTAILDSL